MQSLSGSASSLSESVGQASAHESTAGAPPSLAGRLSRVFRRALLRVQPAHARQPALAARPHPAPWVHHDRQPTAVPSRGQHQLRADAARAALRIQQGGATSHGHRARPTAPFADGNRWLAVCDAVAGWQQEMARRLNRYSGPLLPDASQPTQQGLALAATRMLLAMQQKNRHLVLDSIPVMRLPSALCHAEHLEVLTIHDCDVFEWPASGGLPPNLGALHFSGNRRLTALPGRIGQLLQLRELVVLDSPLRALPTALTQLPRLERLVLQGADLRIVPVELGTLDRLHTLTLASCRQLTQLPASLGELCQLRQLNLRGNPALPALPHTLGQLAMLESLDLRDNGTMRTLPRSVGQLHSLQHLDCSGMSMLAALPDETGDCAALHTLRLRDCLSLRTLPASLGNLKRLAYLDLRGCHGLVDLPQTLRDLPAACRIDVPPHLLARLAALRPAVAQTVQAAASPSPGTGPDWLHLRQNWRARLRPYDAEYGSDALRIWLERCINATQPDVVRAHRDSRRLGILVDGLCDFAVLRSLVFQRAHEHYALGRLDDDGLPLRELMALLMGACVHHGVLPEAHAATLLRNEAFAWLLERSGGGSIDEAVQQLTGWLPLRSYADRYCATGEHGAMAPAQRYAALAREWLRATRAVR